MSILLRLSTTAFLFCAYEKISMIVKDRAYTHHLRKSSTIIVTLTTLSNRMRGIHFAGTENLSLQIKHSKP